LTYSTFEDRVELTVAELDSGRSLVQILSTGLELFPVFAPGAPALAYVTTRRGAVELHVAPLDGGRLAGPARPVVAATGVAPSHPTFSPDGRFLAYQRRAGRERDIYVVAVAGGPERPLVASSAAELAPAWSPTGRELAFIRQSGDRYELCRLPLVDAEPAGEPTRIVELPTSPLTLAWSPDGTRLAVTALEGAGGSALWIVSSRGDAPPELRVEGRTVRRAVWLDNHRVAVSARWTGRGFSLRFVDVRTGTAEEPEVGFEFGSTSLAGYDLDLSPDRELIAFARGDVVGDVWVLEGPPGTF
jgi:Tol biopolymer transport system component